MVVIFCGVFYLAAENDPHDGKRKCETLWPIFKIAHQKSRYVFDLYHRRKEISIKNCMNSVWIKDMLTAI